MSVALAIARRELRGGLRGFRIFLACLALGVAAIAAVGSVRSSIEAGLAREGAVILGGDAEMSFTYRFATEAERDFMDRTATAVSETVDFRSMLTFVRDGTTERGLTQVRGVDRAYPLYGDVVLDPPIPLAEALETRDDLPGAVVQPLLADRLALAPGDRFRLGRQDFELRAILLSEPDGAAGGFALGPRTLVRLDALEGSGLLAPGTLFDSQYRLRLPEGSDLAAIEARARGRFEDTGLRWRDARNGAPGIEEFVERMGAFLVLVGLAGLAVGGVGVSAAVRAYLDGKIATIATLKTLGAESRTIFAAYFAQVGLLTLVGLALGLVLGALLPLAFAPLIEARLPVPVSFSVYPGPLAEAALYGALTALIFTLWPLARTEQVRAAALFRDASGPRGLPRPLFLILIAGLAAALIWLAVAFSGIPRLALGTAGGILGALALLALSALGIRALSRRLARSRALHGRTALRTALGAVGGPGSEATSVVLSLGLGLAVLAAVGQIDSNLRAAIQRDLPEVAPSFFFVDIQTDQLPAFLDRVENDPAVSRVETAPMLRGIVTRINGQPAREVAGDHWVIEGDRGLTYTETAPPASEIVAGEWWPDDYDGPPLVAFAAEEAGEIGIGLGDEITVNVLGRDITAEIAALRDVSFENAGIGFVITMSANALRAAPHSHIATVYAEETAEAAILRDVAGDAPNITAIRVRDAIDQVADALRGLASATSYGAAATLVTGFIVLIGAAAAGERGRVFEAAVLKTVGASRRIILTSFALRAALLGAAAGIVAIAAGALGGWGVMTFVMDTSYAFEPVSATAIVVGGALATLLAGLAFAWRPLSARPARVLRARE